MNDRTETQTVSVAAHLRLRGGESKLAATDAAARQIINDEAEELARKTARLQALRLAKEAQDRNELSDKASELVNKRAAAQR